MHRNYNISDLVKVFFFIFLVYSFRCFSKVNPMPAEHVAPSQDIGSDNRTEPKCAWKRRLGLENVELRHMCLLTTCDHMSNSARRLTSQFTWSLLERVDCWRPPADETHHKAPPKPRHTHTVSHPIPTAPKKFEEVANHTMEGACITIKWLP